MPEGLNLIVGADVTQAEAVLNKFVGSLSETEGAAVNLSSAFVKASQQINNSFAGAKAGVKDLSLTVETLQAKINARKDFIITETDLGKIAKYNQEIESLESVLIQVQNTGKEGFFGGKPLDNLTKKTQLANQAFQKLPVGTRQAGNALINLGRVAQDAPFGFIAIQNNITELLPSFQRLRQETGSTGSALKALGGSLLGAGGIGFAISIVTSLMTYFALSSRGAADEVEKVDSASKAAADRQKEFTDATNAAAQAVVGQAKDLADLRRILLATSGAITEITQATINQGLAGFIFDQKNVELNKIISAEIQKQVKLRKQNNLLAAVPTVNANTFAKDPLDRQIGAAESAIGQLNELGGGLGEFFKKLLDTGKGKSKVSTLVDDTIAEAKRLAAYNDSHRIRSFVFDVDPSETLKQTFDKAVKFIDDVTNRPRTFLLKQTFFQLPPTAFGKIEKAFDKFATEVPKLTKDLTDLIQDQFNRHPILVKFRKTVTDMQTREVERANLVGVSVPGVDKPASLLSDIEKQSIATANAIRDVLTPAFQDLFGAILKGESPIKAFLQGIGQAITQLIQKLIAAAIQAAILSALFPGGLGTVKGFGGFFKNITGFAAGGIVSGPTLALVGEGRGTSRSNPEVIAPLDQLRGMLEGMGGSGSQVIHIVGRTRGQDIRYNQVRTSRKNGRLGG